MPSHRSLDANRNYLLEDIFGALPSNLAVIRDHTTVPMMNPTVMNDNDQVGKLNNALEIDRLNGNAIFDEACTPPLDDYSHSDNDNSNTTTTTISESLSGRPQKADSILENCRRKISLNGRYPRAAIEYSMQRVHYRSRSAGNDALFTIVPIGKACTSFASTTKLQQQTQQQQQQVLGGSARRIPPPPPSSPPTSTNRHKLFHAATNGRGTGGTGGGGAGGGGGLSALKATKKFFKKIYDSATLPGRSHAKTSATNGELQFDERIAITSGGPLFEIRYLSDVDVNDDDDEQHYDGDLNYDHFPSMMQYVDHDSTPSTLKSTTDDPMNDSLLTKSISSNESQKTSSTEFHSWSEVFDHLKREMKYIRERDAQILADLRLVETQLENVKNHSMGSSKSDYSLHFDRNKLKLGDLVDSIPL